MLGMQTNNDPIKGKEAREIREQMFRLANGILSQTDKERRAHLQSLKKDKRHHIEWN